MDAPTDPAADEIRRLKTCISDLIGVLGFRVIWSGSEPSRIVGTLLDILLGTLRLDFAYARCRDPLGGAPVESLRVSQEGDLSLRAAEFGQLLDDRWRDLPPAAVQRVPHPLGYGEVSVVAVRLGLQDDMGFLVAGCRRVDFPLQTERLLLNVAANQAAIGLHEGRRLSQRALELVAANEELNREIAERRRAEEALRRSETYLAEAQKLSRTGSFGWDVASGNIHWSDETYEIMGFDRTIHPSIDHVRQRVHPEDLALYQDALGHATSAAEGLDFEHRLLLDDGSVKHVHVRARLLRRESGTVEYVGAVTDVTRRKRAEAERLKLEERLGQAEKMEAVGTLAGGIAHDFNNILGAILGYGELAQKKVCEGNAIEDELDQVMQAGQRGKRLVEHILAFSRSGTGRRVPVHVGSVVAEALALLAASLPAGIRLQQSLGAGNAAVLGDATQLHQVAMNLCTNALQAMTAGGVLSVTLDRVQLAQPRASSLGTLEPGPHVRLAVSDTGSGIAPAALERIFDPFFTTKGVGKGTGLGLSLVHGIVVDHHGAIDVATREGAGTTFTVWLPARGETAAPAVEDIGDLPRGDGQSVMIVDDERPLVRLAEETLARLGYEPAGFDSPVAALEAFRAEPQRYDLVLTDQTMPDLTGTDLAHEILRLRTDVPVVLMSGLRGPQLAALAQAARVREILHKPLLARDIAEALARARVARHRSGVSPAALRRHRLRNARASTVLPAHYRSHAHAVR